MVTVVLTLFAASCSKPEEVISSRVSLANQNLADKKTAEAIEVLERLNERYPDQPVVLEALGFAYAQANRHADAATSFVQAADKDPASEPLRQLAAEAFFRNGSLDEAAEQHRLYLSGYPADVQSWKKLGEIEERRGDLPRAIDAYLEWYRITNSGDAAFRLGMAFRKLNNTPQAKAWLETTIKHGEVHIKEALFALLELELETGDLAAARKSVQQIDAGFPGSLDESSLAPVRQRLAAWEEADTSLTEARREQQQLARELETMRQQQEQELSTQRAATTPSSTPARTTASSATPTPEPETTAPADDEEPPAAPTETVEEAEQPEPEPPPPAETMTPAAAPTPESGPPPDLQAARAKRAQGNLEGATNDLMDILELDDTRVDVWMELASVHQELGQPEVAEAYLLEARRRAPESLEIEIAYLNFIRQAKSQAAYLDNLQLARQRFPANPNLAYALAYELGQAEGRTARAVMAYEDFLLLADPADPRREAATSFLAGSRPR